MVDWRHVLCYIGFHLSKDDLRIVVLRLVKIDFAVINLDSSSLFGRFVNVNVEILHRLALWLFSSHGPFFSRLSTRDEHQLTPITSIQIVNER